MSIGLHSKDEHVQTLQSNNPSPRYITKENLYSLTQGDVYKIFIIALFIISKNQKQHKCSPTVQWINKSIYIPAVEYYTPMIIHKLLLHAATWVNLINNAEWKKKVAEKCIQYDSYHIKFNIVKLNKTFFDASMKKSWTMNVTKIKVMISCGRMRNDWNHEGIQRIPQVQAIFSNLSRYCICKHLIVTQ